MTNADDQNVKFQNDQQFKLSFNSVKPGYKKPYLLKNSGKIV